MTLNQLLYFQTIARFQHFRLAAQELNISQPSLSRSIASLEEELGIILFERVGRNISLTKYGKIFLEHTDKILNDVSTAEKQMKKLAGNAGHVDIAYVFPLAAHYIPHTVRKFLSNPQNENVSFHFHQSHTKDMIEGLKSERYDVIFGSYVEHEPDIQFVPIMNQEMIVITPPEHPLAVQSNATLRTQSALTGSDKDAPALTAKDSITLEELEKYPLIGYDKTSGLGQFTNRIYQSHGLTPNIICESPDENAIASLVAEDFGIALVADVDILSHFQVRKLHLQDVSFHHTVYLAYLKGHYQVPAVRNFISFIRKEGTAI